MELFLDGKAYNGNVYFLEGTRDATAGRLMAYHFNNGTCLETLTDKAGNVLTFPEYAGKSDYYENGQFRDLTALNKQ